MDNRREKKRPTNRRATNNQGGWLQYSGDKTTAKQRARRRNRLRAQRKREEEKLASLTNLERAALQYLKSLESDEGDMSLTALAKAKSELESAAILWAQAYHINQVKPKAS
jgi:hypothetical protein